MTERLPLVLIDGHPEQLPTGDQLANLGWGGVAIGIGSDAALNSVVISGLYFLGSYNVSPIATSAKVLVQHLHGGSDNNHAAQFMMETETTNMWKRSRLGTTWTAWELVGGSSNTNLAVANITATTLQVTSSTGADATLPSATASAAGVATAAQITKLDEIEAKATRIDPANILFQYEFLGSASDTVWSLGAIAGGSASASTSTVTSAAHPGVLLLRSTTSANSGYRVNTPVGTSGSMVIGNGYECVVIAQIPSSADRDVYIGFTNSIAASAPSNGAFFHIVNLTPTAKQVSSGSTSTAAFSALTAGAWYTFVVSVGASATVFTIYNAAGALVSTQSIFVNRPTAQLGCVIVAFSQGAAQVDLIYPDYLSLSIKNISRTFT